MTKELNFTASFSLALQPLYKSAGGQDDALACMGAPALEWTHMHGGVRASSPVSVCQKVGWRVIPWFLMFQVPVSWNWFDFKVSPSHTFPSTGSCTFSRICNFSFSVIVHRNEWINENLQRVVNVPWMCKSPVSNIEWEGMGLFFFFLTVMVNFQMVIGRIEEGTHSR